MKVRKILLVEDNPDDEFLTRRALQKANVLNEVVVARDGQDAIDYFRGEGAFDGRDLSDLPTVVLLDLKLPRVGGLEVLGFIRSLEHGFRVPVVILTSSDEEEDIVRGYEGGANSYVRKPVDHSGFDEVLRQLGLYWVLVNELPRGPGA